MSNETNKPESFAELFEQSLASQEMRQGEVITAEVVRVDYNFVVVNAGLKSEAYVPIEEFKDDKGEVTVQPGDFVSVAIESVENGYGDTILSRDKAKRLAAWMNLEQALESGELVTSTVTGKVKGGLTVMTNGIRAFLPGSLVDTRPVKDTTPYEGKTFEFKVIKLDRKRNNVVVSRRAVVEANMGEERAKLLETLQEGAIVKGIWAALTACSTSPTSPGAASATRAKSFRLVRKSPPRFSSSTRKSAAFPSASSSSAKIRGSASPAATRRAPASSARSRTSPITVPSLKSKPVSKVSCTFPKWIGRTRTSIRARLCSSVKKSKSWFLTLTKIAAASASA